MSTSNFLYQLRLDLMAGTCLNDRIWCPILSARDYCHRGHCYGVEDGLCWGLCRSASVLDRLRKPAAFILRAVRGDGRVETRHLQVRGA
jgi:hypothetical protein